MMILGRPLAAPLTRIDAETPCTIGFWRDGRLIVLVASRERAELRDDDTVLGSYAGARMVSCELGERLKFWADGAELVSLPGGAGWALYRA